MTKTPHNEFDRLRNQDPAQGIEFDQESLIANLKARLPQGLTDAGFPLLSDSSAQGRGESLPSADGSDEVEPGTIGSSGVGSGGNSSSSKSVVSSSTLEGVRQDEPEAVVPLRETKFRPSWGHLVASVAATALVVGAGPALVDGLGGSSESGMMDAGASATASAGAFGEQQLETSGSTSESFANPERGVTAESSADRAATSWAMSPEERGTRFFGSGLSAQAGTSHVYGFDSSAQVTEEFFESLKSAFGVEGKTRVEWGSFAADNGNNTSLYLGGGNPAHFNFNNFVNGNDSELIAQDVAVDQAKQLMTDVGIDVSEFVFTAKTSTSYSWEMAADGARESGAAEPGAGASGDSQAIEPDLRSSDAAVPFPSLQVSAQPKILGGENTNSEWSFNFVGETLESAYGQLADIVDLGEYEVVSPKQAIERINDGWFGVFSIVYPQDWEGYFSPAVTEGPVTEEDTAPAAGAVPKEGAKVVWQVADVTLTDPELKFGTVWQDGSALMVPVWEFAASSGLKYQVLALTENELDLKN